MKNNQIFQKNHVNGWPVIQRFLVQRHFTQSLLAEHLQISSSAVSQIKQGRFLLNAVQLRAVTDFLQMDDAGISEFYEQIFRGRLLEKEERTPEKIVLSMRRTAMEESPDRAIDFLEEYEPVRESLSGYLARRGIADAGVLILCWRAENAPAGVCGAGRLRLYSQAYPEPGDMVLLKCRGLPCRITRFNGWTSTGGLFADLAADSPEKCILFPGIMWVHPVDDLQFISSEHQGPAAP